MDSIPTRARSLPLLAASVGLMLGGCATGAEDLARTRWLQAQPQAAEAATTEPSHPGDVASLAEALQYAEHHNPGLRASWDEWTAAVAQIPQARTLPDPQLSYAYFIDPIETRVGPLEQRFAFTLTIPWFGKLGLQGQVAVHAANAQAARYEMARRDLQLRVTRLWNDYYYLHRAIAITEENLQLLGNFEEVALRQYSAGRVPHATVIRAQLELGRLEDRLRTLHDQRSPLVASINAELGRPLRTEITWPDSLVDVPVGVEEDQMAEALLRSNPQLAELEANVKRQAAAAKLARRNAGPDFRIGIEYSEVGAARAANVPDSGKNPLAAQASISLPLWFGSNAAERQEHDARLSSSLNQQVQQRDRLLAELERVRFDLRDVERRIDLYSFTLIPKARQSVEVSQNAFVAGESGFLELVDTQRTLLEFALAYERALADRQTQKARLRHLIQESAFQARENQP